MGNTRCGVGDEDLPEEVLIQILVRLPVVSLLRFKSVCKPWYDLIQTSFFIDLHTDTTSNSSSKQLGGSSSFILQASRLAGPEFLVFSCESAVGYGFSEYRYRFGSGGWFLGTDGNWFRGTCDDKKKKSDYDTDHEVVFKLDNLESPQIRYDFGNFIRSTDIVGSCNGLICLFDSKHRDVFLWNPATRQSRILPKSSLTIEDYDNYYFENGFGRTDSLLDDTVFCAFGFDVKTKDYKVLLIAYCTPKTSKQQQQQQLEYFCRVQVYSLSTDSWRLLEGITSLPGLPIEGSLYHHGIYLNGSYFFFVGIKNPSVQLSYDSSLMISFDFTKEIFNTMGFPDDDDDVHRRWYLSCLGEKLALFGIRDYNNDAIQDYNENYGYEDWEEDYNDYENYDYGYEDCDIWVLNEHGGGGGCGGVIKESWTKLHFVQIKRRGAKEWIIPRGILNNGEFALLETRSTGGMEKKMQLYNLVTKEAKTDFLVCRRVKTVEVYKPSLVSIIGGNGAAAAAAATDRVIGGAI